MMRRLQAFFYSNPDRYPPIVNCIRLFAEAGFATDLLCRDDGTPTGVAYPVSTRVTRIPTPAHRSSLANYSTFVGAALRHARRDAVAFIGHDMHGFVPARLVGTLLRRPVVYHVHELIDDRAALPFGSRLVRRFQNRWGRTASLVVVPDADRARILERQLRLPRFPTVVVNAPMLRRPAGEPRLRAALASRGHQFEAVLLRQGTVGPTHAIEPTIRSMPLWRSKRFGFVVIGPGRPEYIAELHALAASLGVDSQFVTLPPVLYDELPGYTIEASAGHSMYEAVDSNNALSTTASNKLMEYMAAKIPVLVSAGPSQVAFVESNDCGVAADDRSAADIAAAVDLLLGDPVAAARMGAAGRKAFEKRYCFERQIAPVIDRLREFVDTR